MMNVIQLRHTLTNVMVSVAFQKKLLLFYLNSFTNHVSNTLPKG